MTHSETTSAAGGGEKPPHVESFAINPEGGPDIYVEGHNRFVNEDDFLEYKAWAERKIAALAAPTAKGGTDLRREFDEYDITQDMIQAGRYAANLNDGTLARIYLAMRAAEIVASPPPPAGAAGGDSGDLGALSAEASPGEWSVWAEKIMGAHDAIVELKEQVEQTRPIGDHLYLLNAGGKCPATTGCGPCSEANAAFIVALVNAYRSGQLISAPTPDLGAQGELVPDLLARLGEPHCWVVPGQDTANANGYIDAHCCQEGEMSKPLWPLEAIRAAGVELPAASRPGSGVSVEDLKTILNVWHQSACYPSASDGELRICAEQILALFAQAPRDGGETQGVPAELSAKWACEELARIRAVIPASLAYEVPDTAKAVASTFREFVRAATEATAFRKQIAALKEGIGEPFMTCRNGVIYPAVELRYRNLRAAQTAHSALVTFFKEAPTPPSGVETIRQDNTSGGL